MSEYGIKFYSDHLNGGGIFQFDANTLVFLTMQTSASLIAACQSYTPKMDEYPNQSDIGKILVDRITMAPHGFTNALQSQAKFIFTLIEYYCLQGKRPFLVSKQEAVLMTNALKSYQAYKSELILNERLLYGGNFGGSQNEFNTKDWTQYNEQFLGLVG